MSKVRLDRAVKKKHSPSKKQSYVSIFIKRLNVKDGGHYHVIVDSIDKNHVSVGLSTKKTKGKKGGTNYKLDKSPLDDGKNSYMRRQGTVAHIGAYKNPRKGTMMPKDYTQAKVYGERAKQKYLSRKRNKKSNDKSVKHCAIHSTMSISRGLKAVVTCI